MEGWFEHRVEMALALSCLLVLRLVVLVPETLVLTLIVHYSILYLGKDLDPTVLTLVYLQFDSVCGGSPVQSG
jgi:hypothetical protein